jgi:hypothetical protein
MRSTRGSRRPRQVLELPRRWFRPCPSRHGWPCVVKPWWSSGATPLIHQGICTLNIQGDIIISCPYFELLQCVLYPYVRQAYDFSRNSVRHGYPWVPTDQGPRGPCQMDLTYQKPSQPASGSGDLIHSPDDFGRPRTTLSRSRVTCWAFGASLSLDHGGGAASRPEDRGILSVITEGDLPKICNRPR